MKKLTYCIIALFFIGATPKTETTQIAIASFNGANSSTCYTAHHLAVIMTYFLNNGDAIKSASLNHNEDGFYLEGEAKLDDGRYQLTRITLQQSDTKLYISPESRVYLCFAKKENDCLLTVKTKPGGGVRVSARSKSGNHGSTSPGMRTNAPDLPGVLVNYLHQLNLEDCN